MKLQVRKFTSGDAQHLVLCDETGMMLPNQKVSSYECKGNEWPSITVKFGIGPGIEFVDGEAIKIAE